MKSKQHPPIDKLAFLYLVNKTILMTLSKGNNTFYIPGGKREKNESDTKALIREVFEELSVRLDPESIKHYGTFTAQAHGKPKGIKVRMTCYTGHFRGNLKPSNEIQNIAYFTYAQRDNVGPVDQLIFDNLFQKGLLE